MENRCILHPKLSFPIVKCLIGYGDDHVMVAVLCVGILCDMSTIPVDRQFDC